MRKSGPARRCEGWDRSKLAPPQPHPILLKQPRSASANKRTEAHADLRERIAIGAQERARGRRNRRECVAQTPTEPALPCLRE